MAAGVAGASEPADDDDGDRRVLTDGDIRLVDDDGGTPRFGDAIAVQPRICCIARSGSKRREHSITSVHSNDRSSASIIGL